jgi:hypothetical protein
MEYSLRYRSSRAEIWRWYWVSWAASGRWRKHLALFSLIVAISVALGWQGFRKLGVAPLFGIAVAVVMLAVVLIPVLSSLISQLLFKNAERELVVSATGWTTKIGRLTGSRRWWETYAVRDLGYAVAIEGEGGNGLVVPTRAFRDAEEKQRFVADTTAWLEAAWTSSG